MIRFSKKQTENYNFVNKKAAVFLIRPPIRISKLYEKPTAL
jgi:hypothetical protein